MSWLPRSNVLVPVDFSDESLAAVETGLSLVEDPEHLHVVNVAPEAVAGDPGFGWQPLEAGHRRGKIMQELNKRLNEPRHKGITIHIMFGDPGSQIASLAEKEQIDLVVIPSHGRTGLARFLIGSVAERVLRLCHCPVLVLRE